MPLPAIPTGTVIQAVFRGTIDGNDGTVNPLENVQWFQYLSGLAPEPAGVPLDTMTFRALGRWATFWRPFQSQQFRYISCSLRAVLAFTAVAPNRYKSVLGSQWTDNTVQTSGTIAFPSTPSFNAMAVRKLTPLPGRGKQGQIRVPGLSTDSLDVGVPNQLDPGFLATVQAAVVAINALALNVSTGMAFSDAMFPVIINGKLINTTPAMPPPFYIEFANGFQVTTDVATQVTRKIGRRRS